MLANAKNTMNFVAMIFISIALLTLPSLIKVWFVDKSSNLKILWSKTYHWIQNYFLHFGIFYKN